MNSLLLVISNYFFALLFAGVSCKTECQYQLHYYFRWYEIVWLRLSVIVLLVEWLYYDNHGQGLRLRRTWTMSAWSRRDIPSHYSTFLLVCRFYYTTWRPATSWVHCHAVLLLLCIRFSAVLYYIALTLHCRRNVELFRIHVCCEHERIMVSWLNYAGRVEYI